ncbi:anti-phage dCTP deaminase [Xanthobacter flavus]|uniref:anti-phage dCTP deaminase n=1 Tax=Xanthobacter flavus TaxID=281 RepID=UPI001AEAB299|nr:anti-phage dCTP deaminase [Xanthobacter flavus]MBP2147907.1 cytidine deaminase [Xanthobacter flavus]
MSQIATPATYPELFVAIAGPIGVDIEHITTTIKKQLDTLEYKSSIIKLTSEMIAFGDDPPPKTDNKYDEFMGKMDFANSIRREYDLPDALARIAISAIRDERNKLLKSNANIEQTAYIIRQIKHPSEVDLLRRVYGKQFILVSAYGTASDRRDLLRESIKLGESTSSSEADISYKVDKLMERDASELGERLGQQLRDAFHLGDVFIDGIDKVKIHNGIERFFNAFFGKTDITPSRDEYAMYAAKSASLRSSDLSRQVGAAIFSDDTALITQGCNEVPKPHGGTYWDNDIPDYRDMKIGYDPNDRQKREVVRDAIERLRLESLLSEKALQFGSDSDIVSALIGKGPGEKAGALANSYLMDLTEYGRVVHAEMGAICDAARFGRSVRGCTLYCTTFPCHNCTKHIIASGIKRVVYIEPYPKSKAKQLHDHEIQLDSESDPSKVCFVPFIGISPLRYRDIFQRGRRKNSDGSVKDWIFDKPKPMLDIEFPAYVGTTEPWAIYPLLGETTAGEIDNAKLDTQKPMDG